MKLHEFIKKENEGKFIKRGFWGPNSKIRMINNKWLDEHDAPYTLTVFDVNSVDWSFAREYTIFDMIKYKLSLETNVIPMPNGDAAIPYQKIIEILNKIEEAK